LNPSAVPKRARMVWNRVATSSPFGVAMAGGQGLEHFVK
jgi:hypothetical protein